MVREVIRMQAQTDVTEGVYSPREAARIMCERPINDGKGCVELDRAHERFQRVTQPRLKRLKKTHTAAEAVAACDRGVFLADFRESNLDSLGKPKVKLAKRRAHRKIIGAKGSTVLLQRKIFTTTSKLTSIEESSKYRLNPIACASEEKLLVTAKSVHADDKRWSERIHLRVADDRAVEARLREKHGMPPL
jgi:hypothetical protein